ncbi:MAG TPA: tetratricopeptide repeat protein [Candidatus Saccharimonadales bacterium]|nr:tetratricopeptide repeat protein [Candidatus Saccharimonadales bacterium]
MFGFGYNKEKSRANAEKYLQQNKLQNAITEYEKILQVEPRDLAILNTVGDIYSRLGQNDKAIERFRVVGESYLNDGFILKSIAMYKKITKLDPNGLQSLEKLAELYRKQGLVSDARSTLLQTAEAYTRKGQSKETLRLLKQLVLFDPENVQVITRTADLMTQSGQKNEAKEMLTQTASTLVERRALDPAQKILDRLIALDRGNMRAQELRAQVTLDLGDAQKAVELYEAIPDLDSRGDGLRNLLTAYLQLGSLDEAYLVCRKLMTVHHDPDGVLKVAARLYKENDTLRALTLYNDFSSEVLAHDKEDVMAHLHGAVSRVRSNPEALQTLYTLFQRAGESSMIAEILELMAHASVQNDQFERARDVYKELIELEPENASHIQGYRQVCARLNPVDGQTPAPAPAPKLQQEPHTLEEFLTSAEPVLPEQKYAPFIEEEIANALTEAELCDSYSSKARGISFLETALKKAPTDLRLNRSLATLYRQEGDLAKAAACYATMQRVLEETGETEAASYYSNLSGSEQTTTWEAKSSEFTARDFDLNADSGANIGANSEDGAGSTEEIDLSGEWESVWQDNPAESVADVVQTPTFDIPEPATAEAAEAYPENITELLEEARFCLAQQIWSEAETAITRLASACPKHPELPALRSELQLHTSVAKEVPATLAQETTFAAVEVIELNEDASPLDLGEPIPMPPLEVPFSAAPSVAPTLNSLAAELDFELGDSFTPAQQPRREAPAPAPAPPKVSAPVNPLPPPPTPQAPMHLEPVQELVPQMIAEAEPDVVDAVVSPSVFGNLLADFERDLATPEEEQDDPETHFNLGIAFREMGLLDEAIGELQKVCRMSGGLSAGRKQEAYIWLATCFVEKSVPEASFNWFLKALESAPNEESRTAVTYELASAYEAAGRKNEALDRFMEVYGTNIDYRDVASRIRELRAAN